MKIAILQFNYAVMSSVVGPYDMFSQINEIVNNFRPDLKIPEIIVEIISTNKPFSQTQFDLIIIPAMQVSHIESVLSSSAELIDWIKNQYEMGSEIASICLGAFLLAKTGLLDNKSATTHWMGAAIFKDMFPQVNLVDDKFITDFQRIYTSGGAFSFTTLMIYLIEKYYGHEVAILVSKVFLIHLHNSNQASYKILNLQKNHSFVSIEKVQEYIELNTDKQLLVEDLALRANMSLRTFMRNFKKATGDTPNSYIQKVRVEKAKKILETHDIGIEQLSFEVGYTDFASFRKIFKKIVGLNPSEYKKLYYKSFAQVC